MSRDASWRFPLLLLVLVAHLWLGWKWAHFHPSGQRRPTAARADQADAEVLMVLDFSVRTPAARASNRSAATRASTPGLLDTGVRMAGNSSAAVLAAVQADAPRALDLEPRPTRQPDFDAPDPLRHGAALEFQATRFDHAWMSEGNLTDVVARRSMVAGALLGALGALRKPCTERQREQYDVECVPDQYRHPGPGE